MGMTAHFKILDSEEYARITANPDQIEDILFPEQLDNPFEGQLDLDKDWHAVHYLLTQKLEPDGSALGDAVVGGTKIGPNLGYDQARLLSPDLVKRISLAMKDVDIGERYKGLDRSAADLSQVYGGFEFCAEEQRHLSDCAQHLESMYDQAASDGKAVLAYFA